MEEGEDQEEVLPERGGGDSGSLEGFKGGKLANHRDHKGVGSQAAVGSGGEEGHVGRECSGELLDTCIFAISPRRRDGVGWRVRVRRAALRCTAGLRGGFGGAVESTMPSRITAPPASW